MRTPWPTPVVVALATAMLLFGCQGDEPDTASSGEPPTPEASGPVETDTEPSDEDEPAPAGESVDVPAPPDEVEPFDDPEELASTLAETERRLADDETPAEHLAGWAAVHQQAYRDLVDHPDWRDTARAAVPPEMRDAYDLTLHAVIQLLELTEPREELPDWRIEPPPPADELRDYYLEAEEEFDVPWTVLAAINLVETRFGRIHGDSHAGARGPMQFMPPTWEAYGEGDVEDPRDAILGAARYLAASGAPDDLEAALFAYNRSDRYVEAVLAHAEAMERYDHYLDVYHGWRVYYRTVDGDVLLEPSTEE